MAVKVPKKKTPQEELSELCGMDFTASEPIIEPAEKISIKELLRRGRRFAKMGLLD